MKKLVVCACVVGIVASIGVAGAYFSAQRTVVDNIVRAGSVAVSVEPTASAISIGNLAPGTAQVRSLNVQNTGTLSADVSITNTRRAGITAFYNALECLVMHGDRELYRGMLSEMRTAPIALQPGENAIVDFAILLPGGVANTFATDHTNFTLYVNAEQRR